MAIALHARGHAAGFDYLLVGHGTGVVRCLGPRTTGTSFRNLLATSERELERTGIPLLQTAWYLPHLRILDDPLDIGAAAVSYIRRHRELAAAYLVAPAGGLIRLTLDTIARAHPTFQLQLVDAPETVLRPLWTVEPLLPHRWYDFDAYTPHSIRGSH